MSGDGIVERLCHLPADERRIRTLGTIVLTSMAAAVEQSGYLSAPEVLTREAVERVLRENPELIDDWFLWSGDQRWAGWCFYESGYDRYTVSYCDDVGERDRMTFSDRTAACTEYILKVVPWAIKNHAPWLPKSKSLSGLT